jgi:mannose-6-phosphate isomerase
MLWVAAWWCSRFAGVGAPVFDGKTPVERERLFDCEHFLLWRLRGQSPFTTGAPGMPRVLVCIEGAGHVEHGGAIYEVGRGDVWFLPAVVGACAFRPRNAVSLLEIALPE